MPHSILFVDDDATLSHAMLRFFERRGWEPSWAATGGEGIAVHDAERPDVVVLDLHLPDRPGLDVLEQLVARDATVLLLTGDGEVRTAVEAMRGGAENFLVKPIRMEHLEAAALRALEKTELRRANRTLAERLAGDHASASLGSSPRMQEMARQVSLLAASDQATVLLLGESGTGKGWVASMIHSQSRRARAPLVEINCAGLSAAFLDSELFGHERGAFTDAKTMKRGLFEIADGGTLFLDEVGDLAPELQPKLLKVLERKAFRRLGGTREITVDVRLIAATNRDLEEEVRAGRFRRDLFYRLNVLPLRLPGLRERAREDVLELVERLLWDISSVHGLAPPALSGETLELLLRYSWPGNVRELRNVLERALVLSSGTVLPEHLPAELRSPAATAQRLFDASRIAPLEEVERQHLERALVVLAGNRTRVAEALGISRATLHVKIKRYGLESIGRG
jgi:DNA-binding NtrC family response regulator